MTKKVPVEGTNMAGKILAGARGNAHSNLQCLTVFAQVGYHAVFGFDAKKSECVVSLFEGDELRKSSSGPTYPVALRRLFDGASEILPGKIVE